MGPSTLMLAWALQGRKGRPRHTFVASEGQRLAQDAIWQMLATACPFRQGTMLMCLRLQGRVIRCYEAPLSPTQVLANT